LPTTARRAWTTPCAAARSPGRSEVDGHVNPIGAKGLGEVAMTGVAAAVANAVFHATGVRVRELPITLDKLLA
jgi:CO/xanthine dehydrogenase Mo-binding subunit